MNILMVLDEEFPPDVRVEKEAASLVKAGHTVNLLCYTRSNRKQKERFRGVDIFRIKISPAIYKFKAISLLVPNYFNFWKKQLNEILSKGQFDIIHFHDLPLAKVCIDAGRKFKLPVIGDYHENRPEIMKLYHHVRSFPGNLLISTQQWEKYQRRLTPKLDQLILITREAREYYRNSYQIPEEKISVVPNYPDLKQLKSYKIDRRIIKKYRNKFSIVYFGDTGLRRGTMTLIETAALLKDDKEFQFIIIGDSREQNLLKQAIKEKQLKNVELTGYIPIEKAVSYFAAAKAGICPFLRNPHHDTTFANKLFQYMAFAKPVLVSDCPAQVRIINESKSGAVFKAGNARDLLKQIKLLKNENIYREMSQNAFEAVHERYNYNQAEKELIKLYKKFEK